MGSRSVNSSLVVKEGALNLDLASTTSRPNRFISTSVAVLPPSKIINAAKARTTGACAISLVDGLPASDSSIHERRRSSVGLAALGARSAVLYPSFEGRMQ